MGSGGGVVAVSACMSGTRGSGGLSSTGDVLEISVVRCVGGVCDMCMCLARTVWVERGCVDERIGFGLYQSCGDRGSVGRVSVLWWCRWGVAWGLGPRSGAVGWCYVCVRCESGFSV